MKQASEQTSERKNHTNERACKYEDKTEEPARKKSKPHNTHTGTTKKQCK